MSDMIENRAALEIGRLTEGVSVREAKQKIKDLICKEQGFETDSPVQDYWFSLSNEEKVEITRRALS